MCSQDSVVRYKAKYIVNLLSLDALDQYQCFCDVSAHPPKVESMEIWVASMWNQSWKQVRLFVCSLTFVTGYAFCEPEQVRLLLGPKARWCVCVFSSEKFLIPFSLS